MPMSGKPDIGGAPQDEVRGIGTAQIILSLKYLVDKRIFQA